MDLKELEARLIKLEDAVFKKPNDTSSPDQLKIYETAHKEFGVKETPGPLSTPRVQEYLKTCGLNVGDDTAWCSAFVNWAVLKSGLKGTNSAAARSWLDWGQSSTGKHGDIVVYWRGSKTGWQGHVGFVNKIESDGSIWTLGGNQGDAVSIVKYPKDRLLAFRSVRSEIKDD